MHFFTLGDKPLVQKSAKFNALWHQIENACKKVKVIFLLRNSLSSQFWKFQHGQMDIFSRFFIFWAGFLICLASDLQIFCQKLVILSCKCWVKNLDKTRKPHLNKNIMHGFALIFQLAFFAPLFIKFYTMTPIENIYAIKVSYITF